MTLTGEEREEIIKRRIEQSLETIDEAELLIGNKSLAAALNRIYYAVFYIISALGVKHKFSTSKHKQLLGWFNKNFVSTGIVKKEYGKFIHNLFNKRMEGDYEVFVEFLKEDVLKLSNQAKEFIEEVKRIIYDD
ncbi:MAG: HEPN domain-containing protein [Ignavibacteriaceae bacterium]